MCRSLSTTFHTPSILCSPKRDLHDLFRLRRADRFAGDRVDQVAPIEVLVVQLGFVLGQTQQPDLVLRFDNRGNAASLQVGDLLPFALEGWAVHHLGQPADVEGAGRLDPNFPELE